MPLAVAVLNSPDVGSGIKANAKAITIIIEQAYDLSSLKASDSRNNGSRCSLPTLKISNEKELYGFFMKNQSRLVPWTGALERRGPTSRAQESGE